MTTDYVKKTLANENELLRAMEAYVRCYSNENFTGSGKVIQKSWADFLKQRAKTNENIVCDRKKSIKESNKETKEIREDMEAECAQLEAYIAASVKRPLYSEKWNWFLNCEKKILANLLGKLDQPKSS
jgi:hypothetical protein